MNSNFPSLPVALNRCETYDLNKIKEVLNLQFSLICDPADLFGGKNVVIKPNLLMKATPERSITTHPAVMEAVIDLIKGYSPLSVTIAESPGGPYNSAALSLIYKSTGMTAVAEKCGVTLNYDTSAENISNPEGKVCKVFNIITPIKNADIIVNVCKLKTHSLTTMSAATKNLFGTIPGIEKFEMHTRYKDLDIFEEMLTDLCSMHLSRVPLLSVVDGIVGMEGNGPSGGDKRKYGVLLSSLNPFNADVACSALLGLEGAVGYIESAKERGLCASSYEELNVIGNGIDELSIKDLKLPETKSLPILKRLPTMFGGRLNKFLEPRPYVPPRNCIGCGECVRSCPAKTIVLLNKRDGKKYALINGDKCIKCYCCQELCPIHAIVIKKNPIFKLIK